MLTPSHLCSVNQWSRLELNQQGADIKLNLPTSLMMTPYQFYSAPNEVLRLLYSV
jgi:hypothetical protein